MSFVCISRAPFAKIVRYKEPHGFLDLTPYGRQESWEDSPAGWPQKPTYG